MKAPEQEIDRLRSGLGELRVGPDLVDLSGVPRIPTGRRRYCGAEPLSLADNLGAAGLRTFTG